MRYLKRLARRYPMQTFLFLFNWVKTLTSHSIQSIQTLYGASGWSWLITSMLLTWLLTFLRGLMRAVIIILLIGAGLWLVYRHFELLQNLKLS